MTIYMVRHGRAAAGAGDLDPGLDDVGQSQARLAADTLAAKRPGTLVVSPMRRCRETMAPLAATLGLEPAVREEVSEVFDPGMSADHRRVMIGPFMQSTWGAQPEELRAWRRRCLDAVLEFAHQAEDAGHDVAVVSHYIAISAVVGEAMNDDRVVPVPIANASISAFEVVDGGFELVIAGATSHLPNELVTGINTALLGQRP
jgi:broad specificity phosphatase PhoE